MRHYYTSPQITQMGEENRALRAAMREIDEAMMSWLPEEKAPRYIEPPAVWDPCYFLGARSTGTNPKQVLDVIGARDAAEMVEDAFSPQTRQMMNVLRAISAEPGQWFEHKPGAPQPVPDSTVVEMRCGGGTRLTARAGELFWDHGAATHWRLPVAEQPIAPATARRMRDFC